MLSKYLAAPLAALILFSSAPGTAHRVEPIRFDLAPSGSGAQTTVLVTNTRSMPITIEAIPELLEIDEDGVETLIAAEDDFLIFPPQAIVEPGKAQSFRVRYIGDPTLTQSRAYRIGINQLPIDMRKDGESGVSVLVNFSTLANIVPDNASPQLTVETITGVADGRWELSIRNAGTRYARLSAATIEFESGGEREEFGPTDTKGWYSENLVLPGQTLTVSIPAPTGFAPDSSTVRLTAGT